MSAVGSLTSWRLLDEGDLSNLVAGPGIEGTYRVGPWPIQDAAVAYHTIDSWTSACGIEPGSLFRFVGAVFQVLGTQHISLGYSDIGYATGYLICRATSGGPLIRISLLHTTVRVLALEAAKCAECGGWATHTLESEDPDPGPYEPEGEREHFCEPCGISYVSTSRIKRLNGVLLKGIV
ncbi:hypothetical protein OHA74_12335 [Streptomyces phaeochromogenes]|uniref:hypothetical protein n=1 Tax=Streptomyces phaeochromogenes TaxID=1923 RepID=UPI002E2DD796|nr:hypothetical protein [Streptomyces phaeochromogenes]